MSQKNATIEYYAYLVDTWVKLKDVAPATITYGLADNKPETRLADIGVLDFKLDNSSGIYTPGETAGFDFGTLIKAVATYVDAEYSRDVERIKFLGAISDIRMESNPSEKVVGVTALDWMDHASKFPIINPPLLTNERTGEGVETITDLMPIPPVPKITNGYETFPTLFDTVRGHTKAYDELAKLANSELGYFYVTNQGLEFQYLFIDSSLSRNGFRALSETYEGENKSFNNDFTSINVDYGKNIINRFTVNAYPKRTDTKTHKLYETERDIYLASGETKTFRVFWKDETGKRTINALPPEGMGNVVSVLHFDQQDGFVYHDELGKTWTSQEADSWITNPKKYGNGAAYFDGSSSYLETPNSPSFNFGDGDFTIEWWEKVLDETAGRATFCFGDAGGTGSPLLVGYSDGTNKLISLSSDGATNDIANGKTFGAINFEWTHYALCRSGSNFYAFADGVLTDSWTSSAAIIQSTESFYLGRNGGSPALASVVDDVRILKGEALYTSAFTPPIEAVEVRAGTYPAMWTGENASGTDITPDLALSAVYGTEGATFTIENTGDFSGFVSIDVFGYGIYSDSAIEDTQEDTASIELYGYQNASIQQSYKQDLAAGILEGRKVINENKMPRIVVNSMTFSANSSDENMGAFLYYDIGDIIKVTDDKHNIIDWTFYIQGITYNLIGKIIGVSYKLRRCFLLRESDGLQVVSVEFNGGYADDYVDFGYLPQVSGDLVNNRAFSAWVRLDAIAESDSLCFVLSTLRPDGGVAIYLQRNSENTGNAYLSFVSSCHNGSVGQWITDASYDFNEEFFHSIFIEYDSSLVTNVAVVYINGELQAISEVQAPTGEKQTEVGSSLLIGNIPSAIFPPPFDRTFDGEIANVRVYDMDNNTYETGDLAAGLNTNGIGELELTGGMVFQALTVYYSDYDNLVNTSPTDENKFIDGLGGCIGTPNGTMTIRAIPV